MKYKKKRIIIALIICFILTACGGQSNNDEPIDSPQQTVYWAGDTITMSDGTAVKITHWDRENFWDDAGNSYATIDYEIKNNSNAAIEVTNGSFNVYVDDYKVEQRAVEDGNVLDGIVLNAGKKASGTIYLLCDDINLDTATKLEVVYGQDGTIKLFDKEDSLPYLTTEDNGIHLDEFAYLDSKAVSMILNDDYEITTKSGRKENRDVFTTDANFKFSVLDDPDGIVIDTVFEITGINAERPTSIYNVTYDMNFDDAMKQLEHAGGTFFEGESLPDGSYSFVMYYMSRNISVTMYKGEGNTIESISMCVDEYY